MDLGLRDRVVLITGGGGGSGPTLGRAFAAEGALVALHHRAGIARARSGPRRRRRTSSRRAAGRSRSVPTSVRPRR